MKTFCYPAKKPFLMALSQALVCLVVTSFAPSALFDPSPSARLILLFYSTLIGNLDKLHSDCSCVPFPRLLVQCVPSSPDCLWDRERHGHPHNSYLSDSLTGRL